MTKSHSSKSGHPVPGKSRNGRNGHLVEVIVGLEHPDAQEVHVCGDFNDWSPAATRMDRLAPKGRWEARLHLAPGRYEYKFVVDGHWTHAPDARLNVPNSYGSLNSVLEVSP